MMPQREHGLEYLRRQRRWKAAVQPLGTATAAAEAEAEKAATAAEAENTATEAE